MSSSESSSCPTLDALKSFWGALFGPGREITAWVIQDDDGDGEECWEYCELCGRCGCYTREPVRLCLRCCALACAGVDADDDLRTAAQRYLLETGASRDAELARLGACLERATEMIDCALKGKRRRRSSCV